MRLWQAVRKLAKKKEKEREKHGDNGEEGEDDESEEEPEVVDVYLYCAHDDCECSTLKPNPRRRDYQRTDQCPNCPHDLLETHMPLEHMQLSRRVLAGTQIKPLPSTLPNIAII